jgi:hypothetical protein
MLIFHVGTRGYNWIALLNIVLQNGDIFMSIGLSHISVGEPQHTASSGTITLKLLTCNTATTSSQIAASSIDIFKQYLTPGIYRPQTDINLNANLGKRLGCIRK